MCNYNSNKMSSNCEVLYNRGLYFIQTGTAHTFTTWASHTDEIKSVPGHLLKRIGDFISKGDLESASTLWMRVCHLLDNTPTINIRRVSSIIFHLAVAAMAIYAFVATILK